MGLADFLATAGQGKTLGHVAEAFGGQTTQQKAIDDFINNQLPALADQIHKAGTKEDVAKAGQSMITSGLKAGITPQGLDKLMEMTIQPALRNMQSGELDKLRTDYGAQPAQPRPPGTEGPLTPQGNFVDPTAEKPIDLNFAMRLGQATGANPEQFNKMLETPGALTSQLLSQKKTQGEIDKELQAQRQRQNLPNTPLGPGQPSLQDIGTLAPAGLPQTLPQREKPEDPLLEERRNLLNAQAIKAAQGPANGGISPYQQFNEEARLRKDFTDQSKNFQQVRDSYNRLVSADTSTPAGSLVALYTFSKTMDPGARITEQDFRSAASARPILERLGISPDSVKSFWEGSRMTKSMRADFLARAKGMYDAEAKQHQQRVGEFSRIANESGLNPSRVITNMEATGEAPAAPAGQGGYSQGASGSGSGAAPTGQGAGAPPVGTISKGYRFKGGNPADRNSWEKVQ